MPTLRTSELTTALTSAVSSALRQADANRSGVLTAAEARGLPTWLQADVAAHRAERRTVRLATYASSFQEKATAALSLGDTDRDGVLSAQEQARLPKLYQDGIAALWGAQPSQPQPPAPASRDVFGVTGTVPASQVRVTTVLDRGLSKPSGLAFNPKDQSLWVVNQGDDSSVVIDGAGTAQQRAQRFVDDSAHFMHHPTAIAFSRERDEFATVQNTDNDYGGHAHGNDFMGPTLFTADRRVFEGGTQSHLDMLHHSPKSMGIAAGADSVRREYWVFNGEVGSVDRYFFNQPHELGGHDHHDGLTVRYAPGSLRRVDGVPGHLALEAASGALYVADTGNGRIAKLDTKTSTAGARQVVGHHDETPLYQVPAATLQTVTSGLQQPSGLLLKDGKLLVAENGTGHLKLLSTDGALLADIDTGVGPGALTGLAQAADGRLFVLDAKRDRVLAVDVAAR